jgi:hypothetical protein
MSLKECITCKKNKDASLFFKERRSCKECVNLKNKCQHNRRKYVCKECGGSGICNHNRLRESCKDCKGSSICEHNKKKSVCKECRGSGICEHYRIRRQCKECGGSQICEHSKLKSRCKECGGSQICEHSKLKSRCKECGGSQICEHDKRKSYCKECGGSQICEHSKLKSKCKECGGSQICEHSKLKSKCKECGGYEICEHSKIRRQCKECGGSQICEHDKRKSYCKECGGSQICEHSKRRTQCIVCNPSCSCIDCKSIFVNKRSYFYPLCQACFCNKYPDHEKSTLYKIKERHLRDELINRFPYNNITMIFDKIVDGGCSKRRPDVLIDMLSHCIIIECDENQHKNYECENRRTMELYTDLGNRPLVFIRFNPDSYTDMYKKVPGCFKPLINVEDIHKKRFYDINKEEWERRIDLLEEIVKKHIETVPDRSITEIKMFYDIN